MDRNVNRSELPRGDSHLGALEFERLVEVHQGRLTRKKTARRNRRFNLGDVANHPNIAVKYRITCPRRGDTNLFFADHPAEVV